MTSRRFLDMHAYLNHTRKHRKRYPYRGIVVLTYESIIIQTALKHVCMFKNPLPVMVFAIPTQPNLKQPSFVFGHLKRLYKFKTLLLVMIFGLSVCMSQVAKHVCMYVSNIHTYTLMSQTYIHTLSDF